MENTDICLKLLEPEEREQLEYMWNLIPEEDRCGMNKGDILFVLDAMDDYLEEVGLLEVDEKSGEVTYLDGDIDETEQLEYIQKAVQEGLHTQPEPLCHALTLVQIQLIMDAEVQYGISQGYYEEE